MQSCDGGRYAFQDFFTVDILVFWAVVKMPPEPAEGGATFLVHVNERQELMLKERIFRSGTGVDLVDT
ncbi:hypothetical protein [Ottowia thiooxydans]|uniref:Uncharacterized protein n=1 Tax=Ottowia thiooxydans TaxID=219182 RepID=A0ABV2QC84_9BURK